MPLTFPPILPEQGDQIKARIYLKPNKNYAIIGVIKTAEFIAKS